ncbi:syndecan-1-like [Scleropages formosus]|uniref:syndecan-1-like n=1 Tax=Scleropages formosus TaxID=113540 RepID=UPI00087912E2|nr:syndecan-1-like [Scleropages formosus]
MKVAGAVAGLFFMCLTCCLPVTPSYSFLLEDMEGSSDDQEFSGSGDWIYKDSVTETKIVDQSTKWPSARLQPNDFDYSGDGRLRGERSENSMFDFDLEDQNEIIPHVRTKDLDSRIFDNADMSWPETLAFGKSRGVLNRSEVLAGVVAAGLVALAMAIMMVSFMVYKLKKKDGGSYDTGSPNEKYQKPQKKKEFFV